MIGNPIRSLTMTKCYEKCKENDKCMYFFFTQQCISGQVCNKPISPHDSGKTICKSETKQRQPTGCCALFNKCERSGHVNNRGHTCMKCYQKWFVSYFKCIIILLNKNVNYSIDRTEIFILCYIITLNCIITKTKNLFTQPGIRFTMRLGMNTVHKNKQRQNKGFQTSIYRPKSSICIFSSYDLILRSFFFAATSYLTIFVKYWRLKRKIS